MTANLSGQILTRLQPRALAAGLRGVGVRAEARESSHFAGGWYVRVVDAQVHFTMEKITPEEYLVDSDADAVELLLAVAAHVSEALMTLDWCHRFEIYEDDQTMMTSYFHHRWPTPD